MVYEYKCEGCKKINEIEMKMTDDQPKSIKCTCGSDCYRHFAVTAIIPPHMKAGAEGFNYENKIPLHGKKYY